MPPAPLGPVNTGNPVVNEGLKNGFPSNDDYFSPVAGFRQAPSSNGQWDINKDLHHFDKRFEKCPIPPPNHSYCPQPPLPCGLRAD